MRFGGEDRTEYLYNMKSTQQAVGNEQLQRTVTWRTGRTSTIIIYNNSIIYNIIVLIVLSIN